MPPDRGFPSFASAMLARRQRSSRDEERDAMPSLPPDARSGRRASRLARAAFEQRLSIGDCGTRLVHPRACTFCQYHLRLASRVLRV